MFRFLIRLAPSTPKSCIFDSNTKASVKVYHLQEYAKYRSGLLEHDSSPDARSACGPYRAESVRDIALYRRIEDWRFLVKDVNACIRDLSPTQLVATAIAYWRLGRVGRSEWKALCSAAARYAYNPNANISGISSSEVALILCCYARVFTQQVPSSLSLLRWIVRDVGRLNERDICMILFYMRRMGCLSPKLESSTHQMYAGMLRAIVMGLAVEGGNKLSKFSPRGLVCVVYNLACIGHIPWSVVYRACNVIRKNVGQLDLKAMALHARSLAMLKFPDTRTLELFAVAIERMKMVDTASITCLLHSYAKLGYRQRGNFTSLLERIHKGIFLFKDHEVAQVSFAMGQLGYRCNEVFESIFLFLENRILHQSPQNLSMFMQSFAKVGLYRREIVELLMGHAKDMKSGFTFSQVLTLLDACVVIGHYDKDAYEWLLSAITQHSEDELSQGVLNKLNRIMYCIRLEVFSYSLYLVTDGSAPSLWRWQLLPRGL